MGRLWVWGRCRGYGGCGGSGAAVVFRVGGKAVG